MLKVFNTNSTTAILIAVILIPPAIVAFWMGVSSCDPVYPGDSKPVKILPEVAEYTSQSLHKDCIGAAQTYAPLTVDVQVRDANNEVYDEVRYYNWSGFDPLTARMPSNGKFKMFIRVFGRCNDCCHRWYPEGKPMFVGGKAHDEKTDGVVSVLPIPVEFQQCVKCSNS